MRPIKFRAWDKTKRMMVGPDDRPDIDRRSVANPGCGLMYCDLESLGIQFDGEIIVTDECSRYDYIKSSDRFILEQFTGLHDKDGKEIYEGDIVRFKNWSPKVVEWGHGTKDHWVACFALNPSLLFLNNTDMAQAEVIGNIHENPELLEEA